MRRRHRARMEATYDDPTAPDDRGASAAGVAKHNAAALREIPPVRAASPAAGRGRSRSRNRSRSPRCRSRSRSRPCSSSSSHSPGSPAADSPGWWRARSGGRLRDSGEDDTGAGGGDSSCGDEERPRGGDLSMRSVSLLFRSSAKEHKHRVQQMTRIFYPTMALGFAFGIFNVVLLSPSLPEEDNRSVFWGKLARMVGPMLVSLLLLFGVHRAPDGVRGASAVAVFEVAVTLQIVADCWAQAWYAGATGASVPVNAAFVVASVCLTGFPWIYHVCMGAGAYPVYVLANYLLAPAGAGMDLDGLWNTGLSLPGFVVIAYVADASIREDFQAHEQLQAFEKRLDGAERRLLTGSGSGTMMGNGAPLASLVPSQHNKHRNRDARLRAQAEVEASCEASGDDDDNDESAGEEGSEGPRNRPAAAAAAAAAATASPGDADAATDQPAGGKPTKQDAPTTAGAVQAALRLPVAAESRVPPATATAGSSRASSRSSSRSSSRASSRAGSRRPSPDLSGGGGGAGSTTGGTRVRRKKVRKDFALHNPPRRPPRSSLDHTLDRAEMVTRMFSQSEARKSFFLATMSHELRSPLTVLAGSTELLAQNKTLTLDREARELVADIHTSGAHLLALVNDILDFSALTSNQNALTLKPVHFDPRDMARTARAIFADQAAAKGVRLACDFSALDRWPDPHVRLVGDVGRIQQIVVNLLSNGVKFTPAGGAVTLHLALEPDLCATNGPANIIISSRSSSGGGGGGGGGGGRRNPHHNPHHGHFNNHHRRHQQRHSIESLNVPGSDKNPTTTNTSSGERDGQLSRRRGNGSGTIFLREGETKQGSASPPLPPPSTGQQQQQQLASLPVILRVTVKDTGIGMSSHVQRKLFRPFKQGHGGVGRAFGGAGLGLCISAQLAARMGGEPIVVDSQQQAGSTFLVSLHLRTVPRPRPREGPRGGAAVAAAATVAAGLPALPAAVADGAGGNDVDGTAAPGRMTKVRAAAGQRELANLKQQDKPPPRQKPLAGMRVLLVDDIQTVRKVGTRMIERLGGEVVTANDGRQAVDAVVAALRGAPLRPPPQQQQQQQQQQQPPFDCVLMDFHMPVMDGVDATRQICRSFGARAPAIIGLTADAMPEATLKFEQAGAAAVVLKPYNMAQLASVIRQHTRTA